MNPQFRQRPFPAGNPLANALVVVVGVIVIGVSLVLGIVAFVALASALLVMAAIIAVRIWWLNRRLSGHARRKGRNSNGRSVIEGEYYVERSDSDRGPAG